MQTLHLTVVCYQDLVTEEKLILAIAKIRLNYSQPSVHSYLR
jgi:hypothetical protein